MTNPDSADDKHPAASQKRRIRLWDLPTRLFHWTLLLCVISSYITQSIGGDAMLWHGICGLTILGLLVFRISWGFVGSTYARFTHFMPRPSSLRAYLQGQWQGVGHNPLGALSVFGLLFILGWLTLTGLFANDDIAFSGYLATLVSKELSNTFTALHKTAKPVLLILIGLHIAAIVFYAFFKKKNLVTPMITGHSEDAPAEANDAKGGGWPALIFSLALAAAAVYFASGSILSSPTPPPQPAAGAAW